MSSLDVFQAFIKYAGWDNLEVAVDIGKESLYLSFPAVEIILNYRSNSLREKIASKSLKAFLGRDLISGKISGNIVNKAGAGTPKVALILLKDFTAIATWEASVNQNIEVAKLLAAGLEDSIRSIAFEQLSIELDVQERQLRLIERMDTKDLFWDITRAIKETCEASGKKPNAFDYSNPMDAINRGLFGKTAKQIREELGIPKSTLNRDHFGRTALRRITAVQDSASRRIRRGEKPCLAVNNAIYELAYEVIDYTH